MPSESEAQSSLSASALFARQLQALKSDGRELAWLHREAQQSAAGRLPRLGVLLDAEEELLEALSQLRVLSPLLLVDGAPGVGKSSLLNALLLGDTAPCLHSGASSCSTAPLPVGRPGARGCRPIIVRPLTVVAESSTGRRCLEGKPSLGEKADARMRVLTDNEWIERLFGTAPPQPPPRAAHSSDAEAPAFEENNPDAPLGVKIVEGKAATKTVDTPATITVDDVERVEQTEGAGPHDAFGALGDAGKASVVAATKATAAAKETDTAVPMAPSAPLIVEDEVTGPTGSAGLTVTLNRTVEEHQATKVSTAVAAVGVGEDTKAAAAAEVYEGNEVSKVAEVGELNKLIADADAGGAAAVAEIAEAATSIEVGGSTSGTEASAVVEICKAEANIDTTAEVSRVASGAVEGTAKAGSLVTREDENVPLVLEDAGSLEAFGSSLWITEIDLEDGRLASSNWMSGCSDVICVVRAAGGGSLAVADEARVRGHIEAGRSILLVVNQCDLELETPIPALSEVAALAKSRLSLSSDGVEKLVGIHAVSLCAKHCDLTAPETSSTEPPQCWLSAWRSCREGVRSFASSAEERRLRDARSYMAEARHAFLHWCSTGAKVVAAANVRFQQDAETVRAARDLITRNIDAAYLAHVFSSVLVGKFDSVCAVLKKLPAPDLGSTWGHHTTRRAMEDHLKHELETRLRLAMVESLQEVTLEMALQERPCLEQIRRIAHRGTDARWDAQVRKLELELRPDQLQHFAAHFFGSLVVGVAAGLGAVALEMLLAELVLGPIGIVAGIATFVVVGAQTADWPSVRKAFVKSVSTRHVELVEKARAQLDFPGLCERRRLRIIEQMDIVLQHLMTEVAALSNSASEFARCALELQSKSWQVEKRH